MILKQPFTILINKHSPIALFKTLDDKYLLFNSIQIIVDKYDEENHIILSGDNVIPFILVHNMRINNIINTLKKNGYNDKNYLFDIVKNSYIENNLNSNLTVDDIYREYDNGIITYDELYISLIIYAQNQYNTP